MDFINEEVRDFKDIFRRFTKKDFSGNTGQAIKNSTYQLATNLTMKLGSLLFTIIIARLLLPEKMGLYSLAISTIILFSTFSDLGLGQALTTLISEKIGKGEKSKAKAYFKTLLKWKISLVIFSSLALLLSSYFIANYYYNKPIFYALLAGCLYIPLVTFNGFAGTFFKGLNNFKTPFTREIIFQFLRLFFVPLGIIVFLKINLSKEILISLIILILTLSFLISLLSFIFPIRKTFLYNVKSERLTKNEATELKKFVFPLSITILSGVFFGYIDILMLGHFVSASYIAYYGAAFALIGSASTIIGFISIAVLPLFSKLQGNSLEKLFKKSRSFMFLISVLAGIFTYFVAYYVVLLAYGIEYSTSINLLKIFSIMLIILPISELYKNYFISQKKTKVIAKLLIFSTILNIILNYFGITYGLNFGEYYAVLGAVFATIISRVFYFIGLILFRKW